MGPFDNIMDDAVVRLERLFDKTSEKQMKPIIDQGIMIARKMDRIIQLLEQK